MKIELPSLFEALLDSREFYGNASSISPDSIIPVGKSQKKPKTIKIGTAPLKGSNIGIEEKPIEKFEKEITEKRELKNCLYKWTELNFIPEKVKVKYDHIMMSRRLDDTPDELKTLLEKPIDLILIDMGPYGHGVVTNQEIKRHQLITTSQVQWR